jgi:hypothetical protein
MNQLERASSAPRMSAPPVAMIALSCIAREFAFALGAKQWRNTGRSRRGSLILSAIARDAVDIAFALNPSLFVRTRA